MGLLERRTSFLFLLILFISFLVGIRGASADSILVQNGTFLCNGTVGGCFSGGNLDDFDGGELLRHYAAGSRWLLQAARTISYGVTQNRNQPACPTAKYSDCIVPGGGGRPCADYNRCKRAVGG
ncbi:OLC1v1009789C1 [Oldenlandia corymbosa var. corymbosa]|uniref:OLC1v1009789C1 n=1 Tax=Oldenlandia corymbosa var. corymbosa TaxID=529605 RepID=A0AAV1DPZ5_OLDCO|nr:OLC1v1009789C1 [Oldenlandia corymbosa var. corymbosa]